MGDTYPRKMWGASWYERKPRRSTATLCAVCGKPRTPSSGVHKKCEGKPRLYEQDQEQKHLAKIQREQDRQFWDHPEVADQRALILQKYGERPQSIKDWWLW